MSNINEKEVILELKNVSKIFDASKGRKLTANDDISLKVYDGETVGIVGESGCGKSTLVRLIAKLDHVSKGEILYRNEPITDLKGKEGHRHIQMIFQDPAEAFSPRMKIKNIICEPLINYKKIKKSEVHDVAVKLLELVGLDESFAERYPKNMSGGQRQRVGIARSIALNPSILICDEATSALDVSVQKNIIDLLIDIQKKQKITILFICHDISLARNFTHRTVVMYLGTIVEIVPGKDLCMGEKIHPYTKALGDSLFYIGMDVNKPIKALDSEIPSPLNKPDGCPFQNRCPQCMDICRTTKPELKEVEDNHMIACHLF